MAFRKEILVYLVGFPLLTGLLALLAYNASYGLSTTPADLQESSRYLETNSWGSLLLLALVWAAVSLRAFCRGEFHLGRRMARTLAEAGLGSAVLTGLALIAFSSSTLAAIGGDWSPTAPGDLRFPYETDSRPISADGRFLFIRQQIRERPLFTRLAVVDLESGSATRWMERPEIHQISWSASEAVLNVLAANGTPTDCLGIPCQRSTSWYRLSPDLRVLSVRKFPGTGFIRQLGSGLLLVTRQASTGQIYRLSDRDGSFAEILTQELDGDPRAWTLDGGAVVVFPTTTSLRAWWLDPQGRVRHEDSVNWKSVQPYYLVGRRILFLEEVLAKARQTDLPPPSNNLESWELVFPKLGGPLDFGSGQFYLQRHKEWAAIWRYGAQQGTWTRILSELQPSEASFVLHALAEDSEWPTRFDVDYRTWTWAATVVSEGRHRLFLYDSRLGRSVPTRVACDPGDEGRTSLKQVQGLAGPLVYFTCWDQAGLKAYRLLEIVPGSGRVRDLPMHATAGWSEIVYDWVYLDPDGISVWVWNTGEVWRTGPGRKRLRLNPASSS